MILEPTNASAMAESMELKEGDILPAPQSSADQAVLALVLQDLALSENRDREWCKFSSWDDNDSIYLFRVPQQRWEGTQTARSSMGVPLVLEHVNAINNQIQEILWEEDPPFSVDGYGSYEDQTMEQRANSELLRALVEKSEAEQAMYRIGHSTALHGTGVAKSFWERKKGYMCPVLEYVPRRYARVASNCRVPDIRKADWKAHITFKSPRQIDKWRDLPGFKDIPSLEQLIRLGVNPKERTNFTPYESTSQTFSSMNLQSEFEPPDPSRGGSVNPAQHPLEIIEYKDDQFVYTILCRKLVIRQIDNREEDKLRFYSAYFIPVDNQFDGIGIAVLNGNEQRFQQGALNTSIDNLALSLLGMFKRKKGSSIFPNQIHVRPGLVVDVDDMADFDPMKFTPLDPAVFDMIEKSDSRAMRRSGANEVTVQGQFPQSSGGIGRTAEGMSALAQGSSARIREYVKVLEKQIMIPFLEFLVETAPKYMSRKEIKEIIGKELAQYYNPVSFSKMKFKILAPTKLKRRSSMLQAIPNLISFYQQEPVQDALKSQQQKVDFNEINWLWTDATGYPVKNNLVKDMTSDEIDQMMSENTLVQQLIVEKAKGQIVTDQKIQISDAENAGRAFRDILKAAVDQQKIDQATYNQMMQMLGGMQAQNKYSQFAASQPQPPQQQGLPNEQPTSQSPGNGKSFGITPY